MRDRLIELIQDSVNGCARNWAEIIADYLLANGVIVPPCKGVGMKTKVEDIKRIIASKKARLEALAQPEMWIKYTKNMECGEIREFKQSCIDDEIIIEALEKLKERERG